MYSTLKSVSKVCNSYFAHTFGVLLIKVITKRKAWAISVYKVVQSVYMVWKVRQKCVQVPEKCVQSVQFILCTHFWHTFDKGNYKVQIWDYQCVQAFAKWVQDAEKYVQSV